MGLKKKHVALCVDLLSYLEKKNSVEPVLLAMCYCISSFPHEVVTVIKNEGKIKTYWKIVVNGQVLKADLNLPLFYCKLI